MLHCNVFWISLIDDRRICGNDTNRATNVKERIYRHFTYYDKEDI